MKQINKKITLAFALFLLCLTAFAQNAAPVWRFLPLLSGYNVLIPTNTASSAIGLTSTNVLYTSYNGQVLYSFSNNVNGGLGTNIIAGDAFKVASLAPDVNGDLVANASLFIRIGDTNWIPQVQTNTVGQWFIPPAGFTNLTWTTAYGGWPLASSSIPNWMYPATTNYYPMFAAWATNIVTVTLYTGAGDPVGNFGDSKLNSSIPQIWETAGSFVFAITGNGTTPVCLSTNLPVTFIQHARRIYATVSLSVNSGNQGNGILLNQLGILQPQ